MSAASTAHSKVVALLSAASPSMTWTAVYGYHAKADLTVPSLSVQVETDLPLDNDRAIDAQELIDNRNVTLSIKIHTAYRLQPTQHATNLIATDEVIRELRENIDLGDGYRIFGVRGVAYDVEHTESATTGAEVQIDIHKVEYYAQS